MSRKQHGFSLVELLVVVATVAMLISLLLPAMGKAKTTTRTVQCASRIRSFSIWIEQFKDDTGWWPVNITWASGTTGPGADGMFVEQMTPYMGPAAITTWNLTADGNFFLCPGEGYTPPPVPDTTYIWEHCHISYGWRLCNYMMTSRFGLGNLPIQVPYWHPKRVGYDFDLSPSRQVMCTEIKGAGQYIGYYGWSNPLITPHFDQAQFLFVDGHCRTFPRTVFDDYASPEMRWY